MAPGALNREGRVAEGGGDAGDGGPHCRSVQLWLGQPAGERCRVERDGGVPGRVAVSGPRGLDEPDPGHDHIAPGFGLARRSRPGLRDGLGLHREDGRGRHRAGAHDGPGGQRRRPVRPRAQPGAGLRGRGLGRRPPARRAQLLLDRGPLDGPGRDQWPDVRDRRLQEDRRPPARPSSREATSPARTPRSWLSGRRPASRPRAAGTSSPARGWGPPSRSHRRRAATR